MKNGAAGSISSPSYANLQELGSSVLLSSLLLAHTKKLVPLLSITMGPVLISYLPTDEHTL